MEVHAVGSQHDPRSPDLPPKRYAVQLHPNRASLDPKVTNSLISTADQVNNPNKTRCFVLVGRCGSILADVVAGSRVAPSQKCHFESIRH
eukprot:1743129-Amphidinium_carterae.1